jgi:hypothetical protein
MEKHHRRFGGRFSWISLIANEKETQIGESSIFLIRRLLEKGYDKKKAQRVLNFIRFFARFNMPKNFTIFEQNLEQLTKNRIPMGIEEAIIQEAKRQGIEQGIDKASSKASNKASNKALNKALSKG